MKEAGTFTAPQRRDSWHGKRLYTVGHSTRTLDELTGLLTASGARTLVDIRTVPRSRRNPQFNTDAFGGLLEKRGIHYVHLGALGGLRRARTDSQNTAWRNASFRGYADHMGTAEFESGLDELYELAVCGCVVLMCAEAVPWRCHRSLVADVLTARGADVFHIIGSAPPRVHRLTPFAKVNDGRVTYPGDSADADRHV